MPRADWSITYESPAGDTSNSTQPLLELAWVRASFTLRRRVPHSGQIVIARGSHHTFADFVAWRELKVYRDGVLWFSGFLGAPTADGEAAEEIVLPVWGNAAALMLQRNLIDASDPSTTLLYRISGTVNGGNIAQSVRERQDHGTGGDWFAAGSITIGSAGLAKFFRSDRNAIQILSEAADLEGYDWRANADYTLDFGPGLAVDRTSSILLFSPANCQITSYEADGSQLTTTVIVASRVPETETTLTANAGAGTNQITVADAGNIYIDDRINIDYPADLAAFTVTAKSGNTLTFTPNLTNAKFTGNRVVFDSAYFYRTQVATAAAAVRQAHHAQVRAVFNDQLRDRTEHSKLATATLNAYNHVLQRATVEVSDQALLQQCLRDGLQPGDLVSLTSAWLPFAATALTVQELTLELDASAPEHLTLALGDRWQDALDVVERRLAGASSAATASSKAV